MAQRDKATPIEAGTPVEAGTPGEGATTARVTAARVILVLVALFTLMNGMKMLADPTGWYWSIPTVPATGPLNTHFVRDIGLAFLTSGALILIAAWRHAQAMTWAPAGIAWIGAHGCLHIWETMAGICSPDRFAADAPAVLGPALLAIIALAMLRWRSAPAGQHAA